jgi:hypothetical protein
MLARQRPHYFPCELLALAYLEQGRALLEGFDSFKLQKARAMSVNARDSFKSLHNCKMVIPMHSSELFRVLEGLCDELCKE